MHFRQAMQQCPRPLGLYPRPHVDLHHVRFCNGKTLAILGMGRIGIQVASRMQAFGMNVCKLANYLSHVCHHFYNYRCSNDNGQIVASHFPSRLIVAIISLFDRHINFVQ